MTVLRHKKNNNLYPMTAEAFDKLKARRPNWAATYEIVENPPKEPKEIKKLSGKPKPEFEQYGFSTNDAVPVVEDAGQEQ